VVTYVASANNYREQNKTLRTSLQAARQKQRSADEQSRDIAAEKQRLEARLSTEIASLDTQIRQLKTDLRNIEREKTDLLQRVSSYASQVETANQTASQQTRLFENAQNELKDTTAERDQLLKEFDDTIRTLNEKLAVIAMVDADLKRLKEGRAQVQASTRAGHAAAGQGSTGQDSTRCARRQKNGIKGSDNGCGFEAFSGRNIHRRSTGRQGGYEVLRYPRPGVYLRDLDSLR
jgi:chromosome segregation ATPase